MDSQSRSSFTAPKTSSASSSVPVFCPLKLSTSIVAIVALSSRPLQIHLFQAPPARPGFGSIVGRDNTSDPTTSFLAGALGSFERVHRACGLGKAATLSRWILGPVNDQIAAVGAGHRTFYHQQIFFFVNT